MNGRDYDEEEYEEGTARGGSNTFMPERREAVLRIAIEGLGGEGSRAGCCSADDLDGVVDPADVLEGI